MELLVIAGILSIAYVLFDWYEEINLGRTKPSLCNAKMPWRSSLPVHYVLQPIVSQSKCIHYIKHRRWLK